MWRTMPSRHDRRTTSRDEASISGTMFSAESVAVVRTYVYCNAYNMSMQRRLTYCWVDPSYRSDGRNPDLGLLARVKKRCVFH
jgi:hypothetical protein